MASKDAKIRIGIVDKTAVQLNKIKRNLMGLKATAMSAGTALTGLGGVAGVAGMAAMARSAISLGSSITDMAIATRTGIEEIQVLNFAAQEAGASQEQMANLLVRVQKSASDASRGLSTAKDAFAKLNINADEFLDLSPEEMLETVGKSLAQAGTDTEAYGAALDLLGTRNAPKLMEVLQRLGTEGFEELARQAREAGQVMDDETARRLDNAADSIDRFKKKVTINVGEVIADGMDKDMGRDILFFRLMKAAGSFAGGLLDAFIYAGKFGGVFLSESLKVIATTFGQDILSALSYAVGSVPGGGVLVPVFNAAISKMDEMKIAAGATVDDVLQKAADSAGELGRFSEFFSQYWQEQIDILKGGFDDVGDSAKDTFDEVGDSLKESSPLVDDIARGVTGMGNALENGLMNAAKNGKAAFGDMAQFILAEIQRIFIRSLILRPLFGAIGGFIGDNPIGNAFSGAYGGASAGGGMVTGGKSYMVGERGPEMVTMGANGYVTPNHKMGGGDVYNIDARGADRAGMAQLEAAIVALNGSIEKRAVNAVRGAQSRKARFL